MAHGDVTEFDRQYAKAVERGRQRGTMGPCARSARYDRAARRIVIEIVSGAVLMVPVDLLEGLRGASDRELSKLELMPRGLDVHWRRLDAQFTVAGLMTGIFGTRTWMTDSDVLEAECGPRPRVPPPGPTGGWGDVPAARKRAAAAGQEQPPETTRSCVRRFRPKASPRDRRANRRRWYAAHQRGPVRLGSTTRKSAQQAGAEHPPLGSD